MPNPLDDDVVYFCGLQNHTVDAKSTRHDIIIERIRPFCLNLIIAEITLNLKILWYFICSIKVTNQMTDVLKLDFTPEM